MVAGSTTLRTPRCMASLKFLVSAQPAPWPEFVENHPDSHLNCGLASDQAAVTFVNHATVLIQLAGYNILTAVRSMLQGVSFAQEAVLGGE